MSEKVEIIFYVMKKLKDFMVILLQSTNKYQVLSTYVDLLFSIFFFKKKIQKDLS